MGSVSIQLHPFHSMLLDLMKLNDNDSFQKNAAEALALARVDPTFWDWVQKYVKYTAGMTGIRDIAALELFIINRDYVDPSDDE